MMLDKQPWEVILEGLKMSLDPSPIDKNEEKILKEKDERRE